MCFSWHQIKWLINFKSGLVIKPGQRVYLDCFIDDKKKFIFNTYEIENTSESIEATSKNGLLEVFFYKEDVVTIKNWRKRFDSVIIYPYTTGVTYPNTYYGGNPTHVNTTGSFVNTEKGLDNFLSLTTPTNASYNFNSNKSIYSSNI